jgi:hypothetical protein
MTTTMRTMTTTMIVLTLVWFFRTMIRDFSKAEQKESTVFETHMDNEAVG